MIIFGREDGFFGALLVALAAGYFGLRELLSIQKIESDDYRKMKAEHSDKIEKLLEKMANTSQTPVDFDSLLKSGLQNLTLEQLYKNGDIVKKREIIGSMYPENLTIDGFGVRTARLNEAVSLIYSLGVGSRLKKKQDKRKNSVLSCLVTPSIQFSDKFLGDLTRLAKLAV